MHKTNAQKSRDTVLLNHIDWLDPDLFKNVNFADMGLMMNLNINNVG